MTEDKELKELLTKWAIQDPSADFTNQVMQRITPSHSFKTPSLFTQRAPQIFLGVFILVSITLLALCLIVHTAMPLQLNIKLSDRYLLQGFYFLIAFWIVMLLNLAFKKLFITPYHT